MTRRPTTNAALPNLPEFGEKEKLAMEKEVLGFYLTSHPLAAARSDAAHVSARTRARSCAKLEARTEVLVGGMLAAIKFSHTKNPRPGSTHTKYAMWDLEDLDGIVRCIIWPEQFAEFGELVKADAILAVRATIDRRPGGEEINLIVQGIDSARGAFGALLERRADSRARRRARRRHSDAAARNRPRLPGQQAACGCGSSWPTAAA